MTQTGQTFAGRVAASLLRAIDLPELITRSPEEYETLAVALAGDAARLAAIREKLASNRLSAPLFDKRLFTRHMEAAYVAMYPSQMSGLPPDHLDISALEA